MAIPVVLYQVWGFVAPGLYQKEKRIAMPLLASSVLLFTQAPPSLILLFSPHLRILHQRRTRQRTSDDRYQQLSGFRAEAIPCIWYRLRNADCRGHSHLTGVTTSESLAQKRPYIIVGCFVFGMLLTPPDVISQSLLAIPMWLLLSSGYFSADYWSLSPAALLTSNRCPEE